MGGGRIRQALEVVAAFEHGHDAASGTCVGDIHELAGRPIEIRFEQIEVGERVAHMGVEACRDHDQVRAEISQPRQDDGFEGSTKLVAAVAGTQRRVDDGVVLAALAHRAGAGIERHLMGRAVHHAAVGPEDVLRTVAVVHVEVDDGGALDAVLFLGVTGGDGGVVEEAKTHRARGLGVVAGAAKAFAALPAITSSTACTAPPAARKAASKLPGDIVVSASSPSRPSFGLASRMAVTYCMGWQSAMVSSAAAGASTRTSARKRSCPSARSMARSRSGRSGWPAGVT